MEIKLYGGKIVLGIGIQLQFSSLLHRLVANQGMQKGFPAALCFP